MSRSSVRSSRMGLPGNMDARRSRPDSNFSVAGTGDGVLMEGINIFEADSFDPDKFVHSKCQSMSEKEIRRLCIELADMKRSSAEEMRKSVYANYAAFIRTSREISDLEGELLTMRNLLAGQAAVLSSLEQGGPPDGAANSSLRNLVQSGRVGEGTEILEIQPEPSELEQRAVLLPDMLDVLLAEQKVEEALEALEEGDRIVEDLQGLPAGVALRTALSERSAQLAEQLAHAAQQPSVRGTELRSAVAALARLGDGPRAHTLLLRAHHERVRMHSRALRPSGTSYGGAYTAALSQLVFSTIAQASSDSAAVFGDQPAYASELVLWANGETEACASLLRRHVLSSSAAAGGLRAAAECVQIAMGHCSLLEEQGLSLCPVMSKLVRPSVEQALAANLKRIEESVAALAAADNWELTVPPAMTRNSLRASASVPSGGSTSNLKLTSSAHRLYAMVQEFLEDVAPIGSMQLTGATLEGLAQLFEMYVNLLIRALPPLDDDDDQRWEGMGSQVNTAIDPAQQLALLGNAAALADELLPRAAVQLSRNAGGVNASVAAGLAFGSSVGSTVGRRGSRGGDTRMSADRARMPEQFALRRRLQRGVDKLRDAYCTRLVAELMYGDGAEARLVPDQYVFMDQTIDAEQWQFENPLPSKPFEALFTELTKVAGDAAGVLGGRERVVTLLLMRLTEALVIALTSDHEFWEGIEGARGHVLGPVGLQQFVLDLNFVMQVAQQGRYSSRAMRQVAADSINRAMNAFAAHSGVDPNNVMPDDSWFQAKSQEALSRLVAMYSQDQSRGNGDQEPTSPTHSVGSDSSYQSQESRNRSERSH